MGRNGNKARQLTIAAVLLVALAITMSICALGRGVAYADIASGTCGNCDWVIDDDGAMTISPTAGLDGVLGGGINKGDWAWNANRGDIRSVAVMPGVKTQNAAGYMFGDCPNLVSVDFSNLDTGVTIDMGNMFSFDSKLSSVSLPAGFGQKVSTTSAMFYNCSSLLSVSLPAGFGSMAGSGSMEQMFYNCSSLTNLTFPEGSGRSAYTMYRMFWKCKNLKTVSLPAGFGTAATTHSVFADCPSLESIVLPAGFGSTSGTTSYLFSGCTKLASVVLPEGIGSASTSSEYMFKDCSSLTSVSFPQGSYASATNMKGMLSGCSSLTSVSLPEGFGATENANLAEMFSGCSSLASLSLPAGFGAGASNVIGIFMNCSSLASIALPEGFGGIAEYGYSAFSGCSSIQSIDLPAGFGSKFEECSNMFRGCSSLKTLTIPEGMGAASWRMMNMFLNCSSLETVDVSRLVVSNNTSMDSMFSGCSSLKSLDLSAWDTSKITSMTWAFEDAGDEGSLDLSSFATSNTGMISAFRNSSWSEVTFGDGFVFNSNSQLSDPPSESPYTGKWTNGAASCTSAELAARSSAELAGTWRWERLSSFAVLNRSDGSLRFYHRPQFQIGEDEVMFDGVDKPVYDGAGQQISPRYCEEMVKSVEVVDDGIAPETMYCYFFGLINLESMDISKLDTSQATSMESMLTSIPLESLPFDSLDTGSAVSMKEMLAYSKLLSVDASVLSDTSHVKDMDGMFSYSPRLKRLDLSSMDTSSVETMSYMFYACQSLQYLTLGEDFSFVGNDCGLCDPPLSEEYTGKWTDGTRVLTAAQLVANYDGSTMAGLWRWQTRSEAKPIEGETYYASGLWGENIWETHDPSDRFQAFSINRGMENPDGYYDRIEPGDSDLADGGVFNGGDFGCAPLGSNMREALIALAYYGADQKTIWDFTNLYSKMGEGSASWQWASSHTFASIPDASSYALYIYAPRDEGRTCLLSARCLAKDSRGGFCARVVDDAGEPVRGAEFEVRDSGGARVASVTSDESGDLGIWETDGSKGLPAGAYTVSQSSAPSGFSPSPTAYSFSVAHAAQVVKDGTANGSSMASPMRFVDAREPSWKGGQIKIDLTVAFGQYEAGAVISIGGSGVTLVTDADGNASTGRRELEPGEYTVSVLKWPDGYGEATEVSYAQGYPDPSVAMVDASTARVTVTDGSVSTVRFMAEGASTADYAQADVRLTGTWGLDGEFRFELSSSAEFDDVEACTGSFDSSNAGTASFHYRAPGDALGHAVTTMWQDAGTDPFMTYDSHVEDFAVMVEPDGRYLRTYLITDDDGIAFSNSFSRPVTFRVVDAAGTPLRDSALAVADAAGAGSGQSLDMSSGAATVGLGSYDYRVSQTRSQAGYAPIDAATISVAKDGTLSAPRSGGVSVSGNTVTVTNGLDLGMDITVSNAADGSQVIQPVWGAQVEVVVTYDNLVPGKEYEIEIRVIDPATGGEIPMAGGDTTKTVILAPDTPSGSATYVVDVDASSLAGDEVRVEASISADGQQGEAESAELSVGQKPSMTGVVAVSAAAYLILSTLSSLVLAAYMAISRRRNRG